MKVSVIVPAYNERENVLPLYEEFKELFKRHGIDDWEVIYVDDGSTDGTYEEAVRLAPRYPFVRVLKHGRNLGKTAAILTGFGVARGKYIAIYDADLQFKAEDILRMVREMEEKGYDLITGKKVGKYEKAFVSKVYNTLNRWLFGVPVSDMNSMKVMRREVLEDIPLRKEWHRYMVALAWIYGYSVGETEITLRPRKFGVSKYRGIGRVFVGVADLLAVWLYTTFIRKPLLTFGSVGLLLWIAGLIVGGVGVALRLAGHGYRPILFLVVLLLIMGTIFWVLALLGEVVASVYDEVRKLRRIVRARR
ncbi:MAG: glycosyltransferase family 2 protein [Thermotogae bacterium]|nr:glycosyltransferase family 2 protein [Thermotogota bacterium]